MWIRPRLALLFVLLGACRRGEPGIELIAAFSQESRVGRVTAAWSDAGGQVRYRVEVVNQLADPLYLRLGNFQLLRDGAVVGRASESSACVVPAGQTVSPLGGLVAIDGAADGFAVERFALPLSERGRSFYREYLLQRRPGDVAAIDAEITAYAAAPPCE